MNYRLLVFLAIMGAIVYYYGKRRDQQMGGEGCEVDVGGRSTSRSKLRPLKMWERKAYFYQRYNAVVFTQFRDRLRRFRDYIRNIDRLKMHKLVRQKRLLPDLVKELVNMFHSIIHSVPVERIEEFNKVLSDLHAILMTIARVTVYDFYHKCPQIRDRDFDYDINLTKDWFIHDYNNPKPFDHRENLNYDFFI